MSTTPPPWSQVRRLLWLIVSSFVVIAATTQSPTWWAWLAPEASPTRELSTILLLMTAAGAALLSRREHPVRWLAVAAVFVALAIDERVAIHERLRDRLLAPNDINLPLFTWVQPGDIVLLVVAGVGLLSLPWFSVLLRGRPEAQAWFGIAAMLSLTAIGLDSLPIEAWSIRAERIFQTSEEVIELGAATAFVCTITCVAELHTNRARRLFAAPGGNSVSAESPERRPRGRLSDVGSIS